MIYPIVIGFVSVLLQRRHSARTSLQIYFHDSAAILTGLSAVFLIGAMSVQFLFLRWADPVVVSAWVVLDGIWFLVNALGVAWFLARTFTFINPTKRAEIRVAYTLTQIWPSELRYKLGHALFAGAVHRGWLPGPPYDKPTTSDTTSVLTSGFGRQKGTLQVAPRGGCNDVIRDIRFRPLSLAIRSWQRRVGRKSATNGAFRPRQQSAGSSVLVLPAEPGEKASAEVGLCRVEHGPSLRWWERTLVRSAFVLARSRPSDTRLEVVDVLSEMISDALVAIEERELVAYRNALQDLTAFHASVVRAGDVCYRAADGTNDTNLPDPRALFTPRSHELWTREYARLFDGVVNALPTTDEVFRRTVYFPGALIREMGNVRDVAILTDVIELSRGLHFRLNCWWQRAVGEQGTMPHGPFQPALLKGPGWSSYDAAIREWVGAWESLKEFQMPPHGHENLSWREAAGLSRLYGTHVESTVHALFHSVRLGNQEGAEWVCDTLIKWWNPTRFRASSAASYMRDERMLSLALLDCPWEQARGFLEVATPGPEPREALQALWAACLRNFWLDVMLTAVYVMLEREAEHPGGESLYQPLIAALVRGDPLREGGPGIGEAWPVRGVDDAVFALLRQHCLGGSAPGAYRERLDRLVESLTEDRETGIVAGRVYSAHRLPGLDALRDGQLLLLCLLVGREWSPSKRLIEAIRRCGDGEDEMARKSVETIRALKDHLRKPCFGQHEEVFRSLQPRLRALETFEAAREALAAGLEALNERVTEQRSARLRDAEISHEKLATIAHWSSGRGFQREQAPVPVALFSRVESSSETREQHQRTVTISDVDKGELVEPRMAPPVFNEAEFYEGLVAETVASSVMRATLQAVRRQRVEAADPQAYWHGVKRAAQQIRTAERSPALLVAGPAEPMWLDAWLRGRDEDDGVRPGDMHATRASRFTTQDCIGQLNDIPVFVAPINAGGSYVADLESLTALKFKEFGERVFVEAETEPKEDPGRVTLKLSWAFEIDVRETTWWALDYRPYEDG